MTTIIHITYEDRRKLLQAVDVENRFVTQEGDVMIYPLEMIHFRAVKELHEGPRHRLA